MLAALALLIAAPTLPAYQGSGVPKAPPGKKKQDTEEKKPEEDPEAKPEDKPGDESEKPEEKAPAAEEPPVFKLSEKDRKKVNKELRAFLLPNKKSRAEMAKGFEKLSKKPIDGHSIMEDVQALSEIANGARVFGTKAGRKGAIVSIKVSPDVHGFPGGVGTVNYWIYLPKGYTDKKLWPVIFCLPNTKAYPDTSRYLKEVWQKKSKAIQNGFIVAVPTPASKGKQWRTDPKSYARAMIALRHVAGTYDQGRKTGGPASDYTRIFIDGGDVAALLAARFSELFAGAILRGSDGAAGSLNMRDTGGLNALPAYCVIDPKKSRQKTFAGILKTDNGATEVVEAADPLAADADKIAEWMTALPARTQPRSIQYTIHDGSFQRHHWINVIGFDSALKPAASFEATCDRANNVVTIKNRGLTEFEISLNDALVDLNREFTIKVIEDDKEYLAWKGKAPRDFAMYLSEQIDSNQPWRVYPVRIAVDMPSLRKKAAEEAAKKAAG
jgi:hypothetical protein